MKNDGHHILITGAARRLGRALAEALLDEGNRITAHYHRSSKAMDEFLKQRGSSSLHTVQQDLERVEELEGFVKKVTQHFGPIDILINSASIYGASNSLQCSPQEWDRYFSINLRAPFFLARECAKEMLKNKGGCIVNIVDTNASRPFRDRTPYVVSKAGLLFLTKNLALEWSPLVRVVAVSPGTLLPAEGASNPPEKKLLQNSGNPQDLVEAVKFVIQNEYLTGIEIKVDGGRSLMPLA